MNLIIIIFSTIFITVFLCNYTFKKEIKLLKKNNSQQKNEERFRKIVEIQTDFILHSLPDTTITFANQSLCQALGLSLEQIIGKKWSDFANPDDLEKDAFHYLEKITPDKPIFMAENRDKRANETIGWTQWINQGIFNDQAELIEIQSVGRDITSLKTIETKLRNSEERLRLVTENMRDLVCLHEIDGTYIYVTSSSQLVLGYDPDELIGKNIESFLHQDDQPYVVQRLNLLLNLDTAKPLIYRMRKKNGDFIWLESLIQPVLNEEQEVIHLQSTSRDISDRIKIEEQLKHDALYDSLTDLGNRNLLIHNLNQALKQINQSSEFSLAVLFLDLDNFKLVNDSLGHLIGDQLLKIIAKKLIQCVRHDNLVARFGGDEFVILLPKINDIKEPITIAEDILMILANPIIIDDTEVFITTSIGIALGNNYYDKAEDLIRDADLAMYRAKSQGRNCYALFALEMHQEFTQRLNLQNDLRKAIENKEFVLYYQPILTLSNLELFGFEALVRWYHPTQGLISPNQFIPLAEESKLIIPLGHLILEQACQQLAQWQQQFPLAKNIKMSINLSVQQLLDSQLLEKIKQVTKKTGIDGKSLILEITETMLVENIQKTSDLLTQIKSQGISISIDDFGTGYSSLSYLHRLPVNAFKIDRSFVNQIQQENETYTIVETIITLSHLLGLSVVAEGIETIEQLTWLCNHQCDLGQGFFFSKPVTPDRAEQLLLKSGVQLW